MTTYDKEAIDRVARLLLRRMKKEGVDELALRLGWTWRSLPPEEKTFYRSVARGAIKAANP